MHNTLKRAIELCLAIYRITDKFPRKEALKQKIRALSIDIIECLVYGRAIPTSSSRFFNCQGLEQKIRVLFAYFAVAEKQGWVDERNFSVLEQAYRDFYRFAIGNFKLTGSDPVNIGVGPQRIPQKFVGGTNWHARLPVGGQAHLPARQAKILGFLKDKKEGETISNIAKVIEASNKTAERDLKKLISAGRVQKLGNTKGARFLVIVDK